MYAESKVFRTFRTTHENVAVHCVVVVVIFAKIDPLAIRILFVPSEAFEYVLSGDPEVFNVRPNMFERRQVNVFNIYPLIQRDHRRYGCVMRRGAPLRLIGEKVE